MHMEKKEEKRSKPRASERMADRLDRIVCWSTEVSIDTLEKMRFAEVERERVTPGNHHPFIAFVRSHPGPRSLTNKPRDISRTLPPIMYPRMMYSLP
ncbi:hypothetical protein T09_10066 [Trichinella sp. T9]|nr:hypothetical protein T09_10066 [Trichinella sp. T9]